MMDRIISCYGIIISSAGFVTSGSNIEGPQPLEIQDQLPFELADENTSNVGTSRSVLSSREF